MTVFQIPDFFYQNKIFNTINIDNVSFVEYRQYNQQIKNQVELKLNLLVFVLSGEKIVYTKDQHFSIKEGEAIILSKDNYLMCEILSEKAKKYESILIFFDDDFIKGFLDKELETIKSNVIKNKKANIFKIDRNNLLTSVLESIIPLFIYDNHNNQKVLKYKLYEIFLLLLDSPIKQDLLSFLKQIYKHESRQIKKLISDNYTQNINLEKIALESGKSLTSLKNSFKKEYNFSPKKLINQQRLEKAEFLLKNSDKNITEICFESGFDNLSYFIKVFKNKYKITPKQYQKINCN